MSNFEIGVNQRAKEYNQKEHRIIWEKHHGKIPDDHCIHHINGDKKDNRIENLECMSRKEHGAKHRLPNRIRIFCPNGTYKVLKIQLISP